MTTAAPATPVLRARGIRVDLTAARSGALRRRSGPVLALAGLDLDLLAADTVWLVGARGMGAAEAARVLCGDLVPTAGTLELDGRSLHAMRGRRRAAAWREVVGLGVGSGGGAKLDPKRTPAELVAEVAAGSARAVGPEHLAQATAELVGLGLAAAPGAPARALSAADRRVVQAARVLAMRPRVVVYAPGEGFAPDRDRVWAAMGVLRDEASTALVLVSEELPDALGPEERALVLCGGRVVEVLGRAGVAQPLHPYTLTLRGPHAGTQQGAAAGSRGAGTVVEANVEGCPYVAGCPRAKSICARDMPQLSRPLGATHDVACHFPEDQRRSDISGPAGAHDNAPGTATVPAPPSDEPTAREFAEG